MEDLQPFNPSEFANALFGTEDIGDGPMLILITRTVLGLFSHDLLYTITLHPIFGHTMLKKYQNIEQIS